MYPEFRDAETTQQASESSPLIWPRPLRWADHPYVSGPGWAGTRPPASVMVGAASVVDRGHPQSTLLSPETASSCAVARGRGPIPSPREDFLRSYHASQIIKESSDPSPSSAKRRLASDPASVLILRHRWICILYKVLSTRMEFEGS